MTSSILSEFDWDDGIAIPVSNAENKQLEEELAALQEENETCSNDAEENQNRIDDMSRHFENVKQEIEYNKGLYKAITNEIETENHMFAIATREEGRMNQEILRFDKWMVKMRDIRNNFENKIFTQSQKIEELKAVFEFDQQALDAWIEEAAGKDEDYITLRKYREEDSSKLKSLTLHIEHLFKESEQKRKVLDTETMNTLTAQIELDRVAEQFRETHKEREQLIGLWEGALEQIQKRDLQMDETASMLTTVKHDTIEQELIKRGKQAFLDHALENNRDMNRMISKQERVAAQLRNDLHDEEEKRIQIKNDFETLQYTVTRTATEVEVVRSHVATLKKQLLHLEDKDVKGKQLKRELIIKLEEMHKAAVSAEQKANIASQVFMEEEQKVADLKKIISRTREFNFRKIEEYQKEVTLERNLIVEYSGGKSALRNLASRLRKLGEHSLKQQEIIYNQEFTVQQLERRMARLQGEMNANDRIDLLRRIAELIEFLEKKRAHHAMLTSQLNRLQDDIRRLRRQMDGIGNDQEEWTEKIKTLELMITLGLKEKASAIKRKQNAMVEENILKLHVRKVQKNINKKANFVLSLEKRALQLGTALKERKQEVSLHHSALMRLLKQNEDERAAMVNELRLKEEDIKNLRSRYEIFILPMAPPEGGEQMSQAYYVIKAAQEKEELQRLGDYLDNDIFKSLKEIKAMENTIKLLNSRNDKMRHSQKKVAETSEEFQLRNQLLEQLHAVRDKYKYKRRQIRELQDDIQALSSALEERLLEESQSLVIVNEKTSSLTQLKKEVTEQKRKLSRAYKQYFRVAREGRELRGQYEPLVEERDIELRNLISQNKDMAHQIAQCTAGYPDLTEAMEKYFTDVRLPLPSPTSSLTSSSSHSSARASVMSKAESRESRSSSSSGSKSSVIKTVDLGLGLQLTSSGNLATKSGTRSSSRSTSSRSSATSMPNC